MDDSYSRLKTKVPKCTEEVMLLKEENEQLKKFKEEITLKQMERDRHLIAQQQMYSQMQNDSECECRKYRQMHEELMREKAEGDKRLYTLDGELFLSKMVEGDLVH